MEKNETQEDEKPIQHLAAGRDNLARFKIGLFFALSGTALVACMAGCSGMNQDIPETDPPTAISQPAITQTYTPKPSATKTDTPKPTATYTAAFTLTPSLTMGPTVSPTAALPWIGELYHDKNQSGERDSDEQALAGYTVCVLNDCATTDITGKFSIANTIGRRSGLLKIIDPNKGTKKEMTKIIELVKKVVIPAYDNNGVNIPEQKLNDIKVKSRGDISIVSGVASKVGMVPQYLGVCPVSMNESKAYILQPYIEGKHYGLDIAAPVGTHIKSPDVCKIEKLYILSDGAHVMNIKCENLPFDRITFGHNDFSLNNFDTLTWYGIPTNIFFSYDGTPRNTAVDRIPVMNGDIYPNQVLHLFMGCTGRCGNTPHLHISFWKLINGEYNEHYNPLEDLNCGFR